MAPNNNQTANSLSPVAAFWRNPRFRICLALFDTRRGRKEGHEHDKVLAFYPSSASQGVRTAIVGLGQALSSFSSSFSPSSCSPVMKSVEADKNRWAMIEAFGSREDDRGIWLMLVVNTAWAGPGAHVEAMHHTLTLLQSQAELLHGPLYQLVDKDPSAVLFMQQVQPLLEELGRRIVQSSSESSLLPSLSNPLAIQAGLPLLHTSQKALIAAQCLVNGLMTISSSGERIIPASLVCWKGGAQPIWCGGPLSTRDCETLSQFTARALIQRPRPMAAAAVEAASGAAAAALPSMMMLAGATIQGVSGTEEGLKTLLSPQSWTKIALSALEEPALGPRLPSSSSAIAGPSASYSPYPTQVSAAIKSKASSIQLDGPGSFFLVPRVSSSPTQEGQGLGGEGSPLPPAKVWVDGLKQYVFLLPYHHGPLIVLILIKDHAQLTRDTLKMVSEVLSSTAPPVASLLCEEVPSNNLWHTPGYRYHVQDQGVVQATPQGKVKTLSSSAVREAASTMERVQSHEESSSEGHLVLATRGYTDASTWVVAMKKGGKVGIVTMEKVPSDRAPLPSALDHARKVLE